MEEIRLQYRGKKIPFRTPPMFKPEFVFGEDPVWVPAETAERLMQVNPCMFHKVGSRGVDADLAIEVAESITPKEDIEEHFICQVCGKEYTSEYFFNKHIETCK